VAFNLNVAQLKFKLLSHAAVFTDTKISDISLLMKFPG